MKALSLGVPFEPDVRLAREERGERVREKLELYAAVLEYHDAV